MLRPAVTLVLLILLLSFSSIMALELPALFADHMVLQQKQQAAFWGHALPGETVQLTATWGATASVKADAAGLWKARLRTPGAGGPWALTISAPSGSRTLSDILIGEVWLCSGQSNMEMPLAGWPPGDPITDSAAEIAAADWPQIRMFTVQRATANTPATDVRGSWQVCTPQNAASFSATAYFFGRTLHQDLGVPVGLVHSSWGGTPVEAWISAGAISTQPAFKDIVQQIAASTAEYAARQRWLESHARIAVDDARGEDRFVGLEFADGACPKPEFGDENWHTMSLPTGWEQTEMGLFDGVVWFRKWVEIPPAWQGADLVVELGPIDDMDVTWFNGERIGAFEKGGFWQAPRLYQVPARLVQPGRNLVAVRVVDNQGGGGIYGRAEQLKVYPAGQPEAALSLAGDWRYLPVAEYLNGQFYQFDVAQADFFSRPKMHIEISAGTPTCLYNAMIAPLVPYALRGAIWYQGESNTGNPRAYRTLFPLMIDNWRHDWGAEFPFYFVQIAPYEYGSGTPSQELREAQMLTLNHPKTGMAVTMDIAAVSIHPPNKQDVGKRLALWALARDYGRRLLCSGPIYKGMKIKGGQIEINFDYTGSGLKAGEKGVTGVEIAGADRQFVSARALIQGKKLLVSSPQVNRPVAVRYAWSNTAEGTLFNQEGLPASSFRTDDWE